MDFLAIRPQRMAEWIAIVDGMSGSGKALISSIIGSFKRGENMLMNFSYDYLCNLLYLKRISRDAFETLLNHNLDEDLYNLLISRHVNFRGSDVTSPQTNLCYEKYAKRVDCKDGDRVVRRMTKERPILNLMTHFVFGFTPELLDALASRLKVFVATIRHPLWLAHEWYLGNWDTRIGQDPRDLQLCFKFGGRTLPWFALEWKEEYPNLKRLEQSIALVALVTSKIKARRADLSETDRKKVCVVPFELFSTHPQPYCEQICEKLESAPTGTTRKLLKKFHIPRRWADELIGAQKELLHKLMDQEGTDMRFRKELDRLSNEYESTYLERAHAGAVR